MELRLNTKPVLINCTLFLFISLFTLTGCSKEQKTLEIDKTTLEKDTTWQDIVILKGDVYVPPGVTLTITPGTIVKFKRIDETSDQNLFDIDSPYYPQQKVPTKIKLSLLPPK